MDGRGPFTVAPVPAGRGPSEKYYYVKNGEPTNGISVEVNFPPKEKTVNVEWELDRTLEMRGGRVAAPADAHSRMDYDLEVITQVGTRVPAGVQLLIANAAGGDPQQAVTCVGGETGAAQQGPGQHPHLDERRRPRPVHDLPGRDLGLLLLADPLRRRPELQPLLLALLGVQRGRRPGPRLGTGKTLNEDIRESINAAYGNGTQQPEPMPTDPILAVDWLVHLQRNAPRIKGLSFGPVHGANGGEAVAVWPTGRPRRSTTTARSRRA